MFNRSPFNTAKFNSLRTLIKQLLFNSNKRQWRLPNNYKIQWNTDSTKVNYKLPENFKIYWK